MKKLSKIILIALIITFSFANFQVRQRAKAEEATQVDPLTASPETAEPQREEKPDPTEIKTIPGITKGTGAHFEITDSQYLNLSLESSSPVELALESVPEMVTIDFEANLLTPTVEITLTGFPPEAKYHLYQDSYENHREIVTDKNGVLTFTQDLILKHHVFIQPRPSTKNLSDNATGGDCLLIGNWNQLIKTCTLSKDLSESISITSHGITLDGNGHKLTGTKTGYGVQISNRNNITVKNLTVENFLMGIYLSGSTGDNFFNNLIKDNSHSGIYGYYRAIGNTFSGNIITGNTYFGINLVYLSDNNVITNNTINLNNLSGVYLNSLGTSVNDNLIIGNKDSGITIDGFGNQNIAGNTIQNNFNAGIFIKNSAGNIIQGNTLQENEANDLFLTASADTHCLQTISSNSGSGGRPIKFVNTSGNVSGGSYSEVIFCNADSSTISGLTINGSSSKKNNGLYLLRTDRTSLSNLTSSDNKYGLYLSYSTFNNLTLNSGLQDNLYALFLDYSDNNFISNSILTNNEEGIFLNFSRNNSLTNNVISHNRKDGILLYKSDNNFLSGNTSNNNASTTTWDNDYYGIALEDCQGNILKNNLMNNNGYNFSLFSWSDPYFNNDIDTSNLADGKPIVILRNLSNQTIDSSTQAATIYCLNCTNVIIKDHNFTKEFAGVYLRKCSNCTVENIRVDDSYVGVYGQYSLSNTIQNTITNNNRYGILFSPYGGCSSGTCQTNTVINNSASNNYYGFYFNADLTTVTGNEFFKNQYGISVYGPNSLVRNNTFKENHFGISARAFTNNKIYNNNFLSNTTQIEISNTTPLLNLSAPTGGNYWSDWSSPDNNNDGFVDFPYAVTTAIQDVFPWTKEFGWLPQTTLKIAGTEGKNGWYLSTVTITLEAIDNEGIAYTEYGFDKANWTTYTEPLVIDSEGEKTLYYRSIDIIGDKEPIKESEIKIDKTPPLITGKTTAPPNENNWYQNNVLIQFSAADEISGLEKASSSATISTEGENLSVLGTAADFAGNSATATVSGINLDKTPPQITVTSPANEKRYFLGEEVLADWSVTDSLAGVATQSATTNTGEKIDTSTVGTKTYLVKTADKAGNETTKAQIYYVGYDFGGFLSPLKEERIHNLGSTIPIKFQLKDALGNFITNAVAELALISDRGLVIDAKSNVNEKNLFLQDGGKTYFYNLETKSLTPGTWQLRVKLNDGSLQFLNLVFRY